MIEVFQMDNNNDNDEIEIEDQIVIGERLVSESSESEGAEFENNHVEEEKVIKHLRRGCNPNLQSRRAQLQERNHV